MHGGLCVVYCTTFFLFKVAKEDISVRFFEEIDDNVVWEGYGDFQHTNVHKQVAISFRTPRYKSIDIDQPVRCYIQLKRPTDGVTSEALPFDYLPLDSDTVELKRKRLKIGNETNLFKNVRTHNQQHQDGQLGLGLPNITDPKIKKEPMENSLSPYHRYANTISPQPPLSPATPAALNQTPYNITPNTTQFGTHLMIPQFIQTSQTSPQQFNQNLLNIPPINSAMKSSPNHDEPTTSTYATEPNATLSLLLDMDNQQFTHFNSGELSSLSLSFLDGHYTSNAATEPSRPDNINNQLEQDNMTDSFTRFATEAIRELNELGTFSNNGNNSNKF